MLEWKSPLKCIWFLENALKVHNQCLLKGKAFLKISFALNILKHFLIFQNNLILKYFILNVWEYQRLNNSVLNYYLGNFLQSIPHQTFKLFAGFINLKAEMALLSWQGVINIHYFNSFHLHFFQLKNNVHY